VFLLNRVLNTSFNCRASGGKIYILWPVTRPEIVIDLRFAQTGVCANFVVYALRLYRSLRVLVGTFGVWKISNLYSFGDIIY
jgi:hypothetical protein